MQYAQSTGTHSSIPVGAEFPITRIPTDSDGYVISFNQEDTDSYMQFYKTNGFVVINNLLPVNSVNRSIEDIWSLIEKIRPSINRNDPSTWEYWCGAYSLGLLSQALSDTAWENRVNPDLYEVFRNIMGMDDLWVSVDNWGLMRPTRRVPSESLPPTLLRVSVEVPEDVPVEDKPDWGSQPRWLHWDLNPFYWTSEKREGMDYEFIGDFISENNGTKNTGEPKVQGLVNLIDTHEEDGGFLIVPGFHKYLKEWATQPHLVTYKKEMQDTFDFVYVPDNDPMQKQVQKISMRAGSLLIWSSEMPHCNYSNNSNKFRMVQYIKMFPAQPGKPGVDHRKRLLLQHVPKELQEIDLASKLFGLMRWDQ